MSERRSELSGGMLGGKVALITGAGSGMGRATATLFAREGARIVAVDISGAEEEIAAELGDASVAVHADVSSEGDVERAVKVAMSRWGRLNIVCNVAGVYISGGMLADCPVETFEEALAINLRGVFLGMKYGIPALITSGGGSIVNWSSGATLRPRPGGSAYTASKAGVEALTRAAALEYGPQNVRVNAVVPGTILTPPVLAARKARPELLDQLAAQTPLRRAGQPEDVAAVALFLASDAARFVTGQTIGVDGGQVLG